MCAECQGRTAKPCAKPRRLVWVERSNMVPVTEKMSDHSCYLRVSGIYVHENWCLGVQRHPPTYMERGRFQDGPETMFQVGVTHIWYLVSVTAPNESRQQPRKKLDQRPSLFSHNGTNIFLFHLVYYEHRRSDRQCLPIFRQSQLGSSVSCLLVSAA